MPPDGAFGAGFGGELVVFDPFPPAKADGALAKPPASDSPAAAMSAKATAEVRLFVIAFMMMVSNSMGCFAIRLRRSAKLASNPSTRCPLGNRTRAPKTKRAPAREPVAV